MAFGDPIQWIIIAVVVLVILLWGPQKIPDLARSIGRARREFDEGSKGAASGQTTTGAPDKTADQVLIETARKLGIYTEGKSREQISQEIVAKMKSQT